MLATAAAAAAVGDTHHHSLTQQHRQMMLAGCTLQRRHTHPAPLLLRLPLLLLTFCVLTVSVSCC
jgi:hypothetical protein